MLVKFLDNKDASNLWDWRWAWLCTAWYMLLCLLYLWLIKNSCDYSGAIIHVIHAFIVCTQNDCVWSSQQKSLCCYLLSLWNANLGLPFLLHKGKCFDVLQERLEGLKCKDNKQVKEWLLWRLGLVYFQNSSRRVWNEGTPLIASSPAPPRFLHVVLTVGRG